MMFLAAELMKAKLFSHF